MSAVLVILVLVAATVGVAAALGAGPLVLIVVPVALGVALWFGVLAFSRRRPSEVTREASRPEFLGPGGPDDPER